MGVGEGGFPLFPDVTDDDFKRGVSSEKTILESENPCPKLILFKVSRPTYQLGLSFDSSPCELPQGRSVATGHTCQAGEGRQQPFRLLPVVSGQLASPPTMLCIYPTSKARAAIKGRKTKQRRN